MIILELRLFKYKRFFLNNVTEIVYKPKENLQIILGANGSGKSSLLKELNPLPADLTRDYNEGGYKYVVVEHLGTVFTLSSGYVAKGKHSCVLDGVELNPGGTRKVQLELVKEYTGVTPNILEVLLNNDRLTTMSPSVRKSWFTELSTVDYTYPVSVYNKLKQRHRDIVGGIKLLQEDIIRNETNNTNIDISKLELDRKHLEEYIEYITSLYEHNVKLNTVDTVGDLSRASKELKNLIAPLEHKLNKNDILTKLNVSKSKVEYINNELHRLGKELDVIDKLQSTRDSVKVESELKEVVDNITAIEKGIYIDLNINMIEDIHRAYNNNITDLYSTVESLRVVDEYRSIDKESSVNMIKDLDNLTVRLRSLINRHNITTEELKHIDEHLKNEDNQVQCPKCDHTFTNKYDKVKHTNLLNIKTKLSEEIEVCQKEYDKLSKTVEELKVRDNIKTQIRTICVNAPECNVIWKYLWSEVDINKTPLTVILNLLNKLLVDINNWIKIKSYLTEKDRLTKELEHVQGLMKLKLEHNQTKIEELNKKLNELTMEKNSNLKIIETCTYELKIVNEIEVSFNEVLSTLKTLNKTFTNNVISLRNKHLTELVNELKGELVKIDHTLNNNKQHVSKLQKDKKLLQDYKNREKILSTMVKELSPSEGLIAKSINSFLNVFITEMNNVINSIWSYSMELLPCDVSDNDLDYKFKVKVNNSEIIEDVSKLSSSMQEIVDLAFRLVFSKYMHLKDVPLFLDEFGRTFDKKHRTTAYSVIDKIISSDYKQIFIVSHYESLYGSLRNVDISVINEDNIDLDSTVKYNQVLKIK